MNDLFGKNIVFKYSCSLYLGKDPVKKKEWHKDGELHKLNGPAIEWGDGSESWSLEGIEYSKEEHNEKIKEYKAEEFELDYIR